jgi:hypothetical protein
MKLTIEPKTPKPLPLDAQYMNHGDMGYVISVLGRLDNVAVGTLVLRHAGLLVGLNTWKSWTLENMRAFAIMIDPLPPGTKVTLEAE